MNNIKYIQLEPDAFLSDLDFQIMSDRQRGIYVSIILYLYRNGGKILSDGQALLKLCNSDPKTFNSDWQTIKHKFQRTKTEIRHKRVTLELKKAHQFFENKRKAGQKGGLSPKINTHVQHKQCLSIAKAQAKLNQCNSMQYNNILHCNAETPIVSVVLPLQKLALAAEDNLEKILPTRTDREKKTFIKVIQHIMSYCQDGRVDKAESIFQDFLSLAKKAAASNAGSKKALFVSWVKNKYGFNRR